MKQYETFSQGFRDEEGDIDDSDSSSSEPLTLPPTPGLLAVFGAPLCLG